jgi:hypothetical protein
MSEAGRIGLAEVQALPRWARLALAARCVRRARRLVRAPAEQARVLDGTLARVEEAAAAGKAGDELADAAAAAYTLALDNLDARGGAAPAGEDEPVVVTCMVAHATAFAAEAATLTDPRHSTHLVAQSIDFAVHAFRVARAPDAPAELTAMRGDLERLGEAARREGWGEETPVPADALGPG